MKKFTNIELSNEAYHNDRKYVSSSGLKLLLKSPKEFHDKYVLGKITVDKKSDALIFGCYIHSLILEPETVCNIYTVFPGAIRRGKEWESFLLLNDGKIIITASQHDQAMKLIDSFNKAVVTIGKHGFELPVNLSTFYTMGVAEESIMGELEEIPVKVRFDYRKAFDLNGELFGSINDLKTTSEYIDSLDKVREICYRMDYDLSAALYVDMASLYFSVPYEFYFTFLSKANGEVKIFRASDEFISSGRIKYKKALAILKEARYTGIYYKHEIEEV
jgi:PDDEXK-like domain of unknown function (DUF3799)